MSPVAPISITSHRQSQYWDLKPPPPPSTATSKTKYTPAGDKACGTLHTNIVGYVCVVINILQSLQMTQCALRRDGWYSSKYCIVKGGLKRSELVSAPKCNTVFVSHDATWSAVLNHVHHLELCAQLTALDVWDVPDTLALWDSMLAIHCRHEPAAQKRLLAMHWAHPAINSMEL